MLRFVSVKIRGENYLLFTADLIISEICFLNYYKVPWLHQNHKVLSVISSICNRSSIFLQ